MTKQAIDMDNKIIEVSYKNQQLTFVSINNKHHRDCTGCAAFLSNLCDVLPDCFDNVIYIRATPENIALATKQRMGIKT